MTVPSFVDSCRFLPTAGGTANFTYSSAVGGYQSPALAGIVNGNTYSYRAESADLTQWEVGKGTYNTSTGVLSRATVLFNSSGTGTGSGQSGAGTAINFTLVPQVAIVALTEDLTNYAVASNNLSDLASASTALTNLSGVSYASQSLTSTDAVGSPSQQTQTRMNIYAAPFDAMMYNGVQINGSMDVSRENQTSAVTFAAGTNSAYVLDNYFVQKTGTNAFTVQQATSVFPGYLNELKLTVTTAEASIGTDFIAIDQKIIGERMASAGWGTANAIPISIGFWVKSSVSGSLKIQMLDTLSTTVASQSPTITAANTAQFITATFSPQTSGSWGTGTNLGASLRFYPALSTSINIAATISNTFEMTGLIVLPGIEMPSSTRAPLIMRRKSIETDELERQLYFSNVSSPKGIAHGTISGVAVGTGTLVINKQFARRMIAAPTVTAWLNGTQNNARNTSAGSTVTLSPNTFDVTQDGFPAYYDTVTPFTTGLGYDFDVKCDARL